MFRSIFGNQATPSKRSFYEYSAKSLDGEEISMSKYNGDVVVVVNVASKLSALDRKYRDQGLRILGFPCNQFGNQEPGTPEDIKKFISQYPVEFQMFEKVDVNGSNAHPLFTFLKHHLNGSLVDAVKWNFTKFVLDHEGTPVQRFGPKDEPDSMIPLLESLLAKRNAQKEQPSQ